MSEGQLLPLTDRNLASCEAITTHVESALTPYATLDSPKLTGVPQLPAETLYGGLQLSSYFTAPLTTLSYGNVQTL
eukprot:1991682-Pleurochrysis_carterae.AAC.1